MSVEQLGLQQAPTFDELMRWSANNGLAVVFLLLFFGLFTWVIRHVLGSLVKQIGEAVTYFTGKLDSITERQEKSFDRLDDRMGQISDRQADAIREFSAALREQSATLAAVGEGLRSMSIFMSRTTTEVVAHREKTENTPPTTGVIKPIEEVQHQ